MSRPSSWNQLAHLPAERLERLGAAARARYLREELPLVPRYAEAAADRRGRALADAAPARAEDLARDPADHVLRPRPGQMRTHWPFLRKFAMALAGPRSQALLDHAYRVLRTEPDRVPGGPEFPLARTAHDLDLAAEAGARALDVLGLAAPGVRTLLALPAHAPLFEPLLLAAPRAAAALEWTGGPRLADAGEHARRLASCQALVATPGLAGWILSAAAGQASAAGLRTLVLVARSISRPLRDRLARLALAAGTGELAIGQLACLPGSRLPLAACPTPAGDPAGSGPEPSGLHLLPDLLDLEVGEEELLLTPVASHGTGFLRLATGLGPATVEPEPCVACGRTLPRTAGCLVPVRGRSVAADLDGIEGLLAWRVLADGDALELACADGRREAVHARAREVLGAGSGAPRLTDAPELLDWLGGTAEREERHVLAPPPG